MNIKQIFAKRLKFLREEAGLNQTQLAKALNVSRGSISFYESCDRAPDIEFLSKLATFFDVSADWLIGRTEHSTIDGNETLAKDVGLSDDSIRILKRIYDKTEGAMLLPTINYLIDQEGNALESHGKESDEFVPILSCIESFLLKRPVIRVEVAGDFDDYVSYQTMGLSAPMFQEAIVDQMFFHKLTYRLEKLREKMHYSVEDMPYVEED